ncbi:hypothetical protein NX722_28545 [Endozoicomonas gorgoniicola]|uniref:Uncharacterized protein n=1 Tax=Endozoicomonas gorgoniicola TaxID=1234144 RepID=A0ABT3N4G3_9GAMM|nr:hypothetical protein [Endozoicomonas gorgoniicola]MCW7556462.1 hypothetical protein [Endozoicomonas gorgoniicola]MCW7556517.1 hypothetical protein [Endozoicomonas gorgoniicola]
MNFKKFWKELTEQERDDFCRRVGCSKDVVRNVYLSPNPLRRNHPSKMRLARMVVFSNNKLKVGSLLKYFSGEGVEQLIGEVQKVKDPVSGA